MATWQTTKGIFSISADTLYARVDAGTLDLELRALAVTVALDGVSVTGDTLVLDYRAEPSAAEKTTIEAAVAAHDGIPRVETQPHVTARGELEVQVRPRSGTPVEEYSVNWCDPTTWHPDSVRVENVVATATADPLVFDLPDVNIIDVTHGKITQEVFLTDKAPVVQVGGVTLTEREFGYDDHDPSWGPNPYDAGDYAIDYAAGTISFFSAPSEAPTVTYYKSTTANWYLTPVTGKDLRILTVEVQFSVDIEMRDSIVFAPEIMAAAAAAGGVLDPALLASNGGPVADTDYLPVPGQLREYKVIKDFVVESQRTYPIIQAVGGTNARALKRSAVVWRWPYEEGGSRELSALQGTRIRIGLKHSIAFGGDFAEASAYAVSESAV